MTVVAVGYSYVYFADATLPPDLHAPWLASDSDPGGFEDWPDGWGLDEADIPMTVAELLDVLRAEPLARVELDGDRLCVRVIVDKGMDGWLTYRSNVAGGFRRLAEHGGVGRLVMMTFDDAAFDEGVAVDVKPGGESSCVVLNEGEVGALRDGPAYAEVRELAEAFVSRFLDE